MQEIVVGWLIFVERISFGEGDVGEVKIYWCWTFQIQILLFIDEASFIFISNNVIWCLSFDEIVEKDDWVVLINQNILTWFVQGNEKINLNIFALFLSLNCLNIPSLTLVLIHNFKFIYFCLFYDYIIGDGAIVTE